MPDINVQVFEEVQRNQLVTEVDIQTQVALDDYQMQLSNIANPTQSQDNVVIDRFGEFLPHWNESLDFDTWIKMSMEIAGKRILMLRGNSNVSSVSNGSNTFIVFDDFSTNLLGTYWLGDTGNFSIISGKLITSTTGATLYRSVDFSNLSNYKIFAIMKADAVGGTYTYSTTGTGDTNTGLRGVGDSAFILVHSSSNSVKVGTGYADNSVDTTTWHFDGPTAEVYEEYLLTKIGVNYKYYFENTLKQTYTPTLIEPSFFILDCQSGQGFWDLVYLAKATSTEPIWTANGSPQNIAVALKSLGRAG